MPIRARRAQSAAQPPHASPGAQYQARRSPSILASPPTPSRRMCNHTAEPVIQPAGAPLRRQSADHVHGLAWCNRRPPRVRGSRPQCPLGPACRSPTVAESADRAASRRSVWLAGCSVILRLGHTCRSDSPQSPVGRPTDDRTCSSESACSVTRGVQNWNICVQAPRCGTPSVSRAESAI